MDDNYLIVKNPDKEYRNKILKLIKENDGYCPCKPKSSDTKCYCKEYKEHGDCICGLFIKIPCYEIT